MTTKLAKSAPAAIVAALALLSGCANYQFGTTLPKHLRSVSVETFANKSDEPQIETSITSATLLEFQRDGQLKGKSPEEADILLTGTITEYKLEQVLADRNNPKSTKEYKAIVSVHISAVERKTGKKVVTQTITGSKTFAPQGDLMTARRNILPDLSRDVAKKVVDAVVSAW